MSKVNGRGPKVLKGESNPRHYIMIPVGTGNKYCCNCNHFCIAQSLCGIFMENLKMSHGFGAERCYRCIDAERLIQETKNNSMKDGEDAAFFRDNYHSERKSGTLDM
jgi:hypothetical protein